MKQAMSLLGIVNPTVNGPCFAIPIFEYGKRLYVQSIDAKDRITDFDEVQIDGAKVSAPAQVIHKDIGEPALFAFWQSETNQTIGPRQMVEAVVRDLYSSLSNRPFLRWDIAEFLGDAQMVSEAKTQAEEMLKETPSGSARVAGIASNSMMTSDSSFAAEQVAAIATKNGFRILESRELPPRAPKHLPFPEKLSRQIRQILAEKYPDGLYSHQARAIEAALSGQDICLATPTASGKTDVFIAVSLDLMVRDHSATVVAMYPALALIQDQLSKWNSMLSPLGASAGVIDGSVDTRLRLDILKSHAVILMTPDVAHAWLMSNLEKAEVADFLSRIRLLILDEAHAYEGVFGTNMAYFLRRFEAVAHRYQTIYSTATLGNEEEFVGQLSGKKATHFGLKEDGSASSGKTVLLASGGDFDAASHLLSDLAVQRRGRFLAFADSRKEVEQLIAAARRQDDKSSADEETAGLPLRDKSNPVAPPILPYRAGYEAKDRIEIQRALSTGKLAGVACTSALELGIDIGDIDLVIMLNTPPSVKSFWQRIGRGGRRRHGVCLILDRQKSLSVRGLDAELSRPIEPNYLYLENRCIQFANALCAASECSKLRNRETAMSTFRSLPADFLGFLRNELDPTEPVADDLFVLKQRAESNPHHEFLLRSGIEKQFTIKAGGEQDLGTLTLSQMLREGYPGAIYYYMSTPYRVERMKYQDGELLVKRTRSWTTQPVGQTMVFPKFPGGILNLWLHSEGFLAEATVQVSERVIGFRERRGSAKPEEHVYQAGSPYYQKPLNRFFETTGVCWYSSKESGGLKESSERMASLILETFCTEYGILSRDLGIGHFISKSSPNGSSEVSGVCIYDAADGSLRLTQRLAEHFAEVVKVARNNAIARQTDDDADLDTIEDFAARLQRTAVRGEYTGGESDEWTQVIAPGQSVMYVTELDTCEVEIRGYRYTPRGLYYEIEDPRVDRHLVPSNCLRPIFGSTKMIMVNLMTGESKQAS